MNEQILSLVRLRDFKNINTYTSSFGTSYVTGTLRGDQYTISENKGHYIVDRNGRYLLVTFHIEDVLLVIMRISDGDEITVNLETRLREIEVRVMMQKLDL